VWGLTGRRNAWLLSPQVRFKGIGARMVHVEMVSAFVTQFGQVNYVDGELFLWYLGL
jgi:hypothetical protein